MAGQAADSAKSADAIIGEALNLIAHGTELVGQTANSLQSVIALNKDVLDKADAIQELCNEQTTLVDNVSEGTSKISTVIQSNSAAAEESAAASEELSAQAETLNQLMNSFIL